MIMFSLQLADNPDVIRKYANILGGDCVRNIDFALGPASRGSGYVLGVQNELGEPCGVTWCYFTADPETIYVPYVHVIEQWRGYGLVGILDRGLADIARAGNIKHAFGLASVANVSSNRALCRSGWHLVGIARDFYFCEGQTNLYYKDYLDAENNEAPTTGVFWEDIWRRVDRRGKHG